MFFRLKKSGERAYVQIVENKRVDGAVRQSVVATVGRADELAASGGLASLLASGAKFCDQVLLIQASEQNATEGGFSLVGQNAPAARCCSAGSGKGSASTPFSAIC